MTISLLTEKRCIKGKYEIAFAKGAVKSDRIFTLLHYTCYLVIYSNGKTQITAGMKEVNFS